MTRGEVDSPNPTRSPGVGRVEVLQEIGGVDVPFVHPTVLLRPITLPLDQELEAAPVHATVQNLLHLVLLVILHQLRGRWRRCVTTGEGVGQGRGEFDNREYWV
jgi:hypothetical protein